nr:leucine-rich repeat domain-containing protein [Candidatus Sigynarchaeum springense]
MNRPGTGPRATCPKCGTEYELPDDRQYECPSCGVPLQPAQVPGTAMPGDVPAPGVQASAGTRRRFKALFKKSKAVAISAIVEALELAPATPIPALLQAMKLDPYFDVRPPSVVRNDVPMPWERVKDGLKRAGKWALKNSIPVAISLATGGLGLGAAVAPVVSHVVSFLRKKGLAISGHATRLIEETITSGSENMIQELQDRIRADNQGTRGSAGETLSPEAVSCLVQMSIGEVMPGIIEEIRAVVGTLGEQMVTDLRDVFDGWLDEQREELARGRGEESVKLAKALDELENALGKELASIKSSVVSIHENVLAAAARLDGIEAAMGRLFEALCQRSLADFSLDELVQASAVQFERTRLASRFDIPFDPALFVPLPAFDIAFISFLDQRGVAKPLFLVLAHMGMGKTWNAVHAGMIARETRRFVPFFIPFNLGWQNQLASIFGTKTSLANDIGSVALAIHQHHGRAVKLLLIFDGLDELFGNAPRSEFLSFLLQLLNGFGHAVSVVLTCRDTVWAQDRAIGAREPELRVHSHDSAATRDVATRVGSRTPVGYYLDAFPRELLAGDEGLLARYGVDWRRVEQRPLLLDLCRRPYMARLLRGLDGYPDPSDGNAFLGLFYSDEHPEDTVLFRMGIIRDVEKLFFDVIRLFTASNDLVPEERLEKVVGTRLEEWQVILSAGIIEFTKRGPRYLYRVDLAFHPVVMALKRWIEGGEPGPVLGHGAGIMEAPETPVTGAPTTTKSEGRKKYDYHVQLGKDAMAEGNWDEAMQQFQNAAAEAEALLDVPLRKEAKNLAAAAAQAREKAEREAREKAEREAREKAEREAREKAARESKKRAEREALEKPRRDWQQRNPGINVPGEEIDALVAIERLTGKPIPRVADVQWDTFGLVAEGGHVAKLGLHEQGLTSLPESIGNLVNLEKLYLSGNQLSSLPESIGQLKSLTWLSLSNNQLSSLPGTIGNLESLTVLDLSSNKISSLPGTIKDWIKALEQKGCKVFQ